MMTISSGYRVEYLTKEVATGRENYYLSEVERGTEPPGIWRGRGAADLGLEGEVDSQALVSLYEKATGPGGQQVGRPLNNYEAMRERADIAIADAIAAAKAEGRQLLPGDITRIRDGELAKVRSGVAFFDFTLSVPKSVSVAWIAFRAEVATARAEGRDADAALMQGRVEAIERAIAYARDAAVESIEENTYTRLGHHGGGGVGEWHKATGVIAATFMQHTSREGDPQLHCHIAVRNAVQCDVDDKWRTADSRHLDGVEAWYRC